MPSHNKLCSCSHHRSAHTYNSECQGRCEPHRCTVPGCECTSYIAKRHLRVMRDAITFHNHLEAERRYREQRNAEKLLRLGERYGMMEPRRTFKQHNHKPGERIILSEVDYSSLELRVMAEAAKQEKKRREEDGNDSED